MSLKTTLRAATSSLRPAILLPILALLAAAALTGCGGGGDADPDAVVATVGDRTVTVRDYEMMLSKLQPGELPRAEDGTPLDMASEEGKRAFLEIVVNKELMAAKAVDLGFDMDDNMRRADDALTEHYAGKLMFEELNKIPSQNVSEAEIDAYYENQKTIRHVRFMICNFKDDALEARRRILDGALWDDVAEEFNDGSKGPNGNYTLALQWGRMEDAFEEAVFDLEVGEVSEPIDTVYGWWIIRLDSVSENRVPALTEEQRERIRQTLQARKSNVMNAEFVDASREKHEVYLDETALWLVFNGMPETEDYLDPETKKPVPVGKLQPLDVPTEELDRVFFSAKFDLDGEPEVWTIGDYKAQYDQWNVFQRPKRAELLGGVRKKILNDMVDRRLMIAEARERGYFERPEVTGEVGMNLEKAMVQKLHEEVVTIDEAITPEQIDAFWAEHADEYYQQEVRYGHVVYTTERAGAEAAAATAADGDWDAVLEAHSENPQNKEAGGEVKMPASGSGALRDALFGMTEPGEISSPVPVEGGWAVARLDSVQPGRPMELDEVRSAVGERIKSIRKNEALNDLLDQWREEYGVTVRDDVLPALKSWDELTAGVE